MEFLNKFFSVDHLRDVPRGVTLVAVSRTIRWIGWGFGESLIPIFLLAFSHSFTETGLFKSVYDIAFLLALPIVSLVADSVSSRTLMVLALLIYPFVGISYFLAGITGIGILIIFARGFNGIAYCLDTIGVDTYLRRTAPKHAESSVFGYIESVTNFGWIMAALFGFFLIKYIPVYVLLLLIAPTSYLALLPLRRLKDGQPNTTRAASVLHSYQALFQNVRTWHVGQRRVAILTFFLALTSGISTFFLPIAAYEGGASLQEVILMTVLFSLPFLGAWSISNIVDYTNKRILLLVLLFMLPVLFLFVAAAPSYTVEALAAFAVETIAVGENLILQAYITVISPRERFGSITGAMDGISEIAAVVTPILAGIVADIVGLRGMFAVIGVLSLGVAFYAYRYPITHRIPDDPVPTFVPLP